MNSLSYDEPREFQRGELDGLETGGVGIFYDLGFTVHTMDHSYADSQRHPPAQLSLVHRRLISPPAIGATPCIFDQTALHVRYAPFVPVADSILRENRWQVTCDRPCLLQ